MSIKYLSAHEIAAADTNETIVRQYRLSSWEAIRGIPANRALGTKLPDSGPLPVGLVISIPPNAIFMAKERIYALNEIRPMILRHFEAIRGAADDVLLAAISGARRPADSEQVGQVLLQLHQEVATATATISRRAKKLVDICKAMCHTHVGDSFDFAARDAAHDPKCGLYWALRPDTVALWEGMWVTSLWRERWRGKSGDDAWVNASNYLNTIASIVTQNVDRRLREALALERRLRDEA